jgi:hypothetical protein
VFAPIANRSEMRGDVLTVPLDAVDPDGDSVTFSIVPTPGLPNATLTGNRLTFTPTPSQFGTYDVVVRASDGILKADRTFTLRVVADPVTTTR